MKVVEKDGFIVSHGYDRGLSKPDRERAGGELVKKGAFIHPPSAAPPSVVAAAEPPTPSPAACSRSSWGSRTVEEELTSAPRWRRESTESGVHTLEVGLVDVW